MHTTLLILTALSPSTLTELNLSASAVTAGFSLNEEEERFLTCAQKGEVYRGDGKLNAVDPSILRWLTWPNNSGQLPRGMRIQNATFNIIDLRSVSPDFDLEFENCRIKSLRLNDSQFRSVRLKDCTILELEAPDMQCEYSISIENTSTKIVELVGSQVGRSLDVFKLRPSGKGVHVKFNADAIVVGGNISLLDLEAIDTLNFRGARATEMNMSGTVREADLQGMQLESMVIGIAGEESKEIGRTYFGTIVSPAPFSAKKLVLDLLLANGVVDLQRGNACRMTADRCKISQLTIRGFDIEVLQLKSSSLNQLEVKSAIGEAELQNSQIGQFDDRLKSWNGKVEQEGLRVRHFSETEDLSIEETLAKRLKFIERDPDQAERVNPQPYVMLAESLRAMGRNSEADKVMIERSKKESPWYISLLLWPIGYGYAPQKGLLMLVGLWALGVCMFSQARDQGAFVRIDGDEKICFSVVAYSLDALVPLVDLGQARFWIPNPASDVRGRIDWGKCARRFYWGYHFAGFILSTLIAGALTGVIK